jgi:hypothetical protein
MTVEGSIKVAREGNATRHVTVGLSGQAFEALGSDESGAATQPPVRMRHALRCYLGDRGSDRPAWPYPSFLREAESQRDALLELDVEERLWRDFEEEASRQGIDVDRLAEHAAFYFAAELEAGRLTERILEDLEAGDEDGPAA